MNLLLLPLAAAAAAENMARDLLLLEAFAGPDEPRLRAYGWSQPAWTFGYRQRFTEALAAAGPDVGLVRRPTGGGLVDHRADWTYALVLPAAHPLARARAPESYRAVHDALRRALAPLGVPAAWGCGEKPSPAVAAQCFAQPEPLDLVRADDGRKIAGAAQKRVRAGLLVQGSVSRAAAPEVRDWGALPPGFAAALGRALGAEPRPWEGEPCDAAKLARRRQEFASADWNRRR